MWSALRSAVVFGGSALVLSLFGCSSAVVDQGTSEDGLTDNSEQRSYSEAQVEQLLLNAGFIPSVVPKMVCIGLYESGLNALAARSKKNGSWDLGLFMINTVHAGNTPGCPVRAEGLYDPQANAKCALGVHSMYGLKGWPSYVENRDVCEHYRINRTPTVPQQTTPVTPTTPGTTPGVLGR